MTLTLNPQLQNFVNRIPFEKTKIFSQNNRIPPPIKISVDNITVLISCLS